MTTSDLSAGIAARDLDVTDGADEARAFGIAEQDPSPPLQNAISADHAAYGITPGNEHASCYFDGGPAAVANDCQGYLYYDRIHPTSAIHQRIADAVLAAIPEPASWMLMIVGFGFVGATLRRDRVRTATTAVAC